MSKVEMERKLKSSLDKLDGAAEKVVQTRGYTKEVKKIKMLSELIREQLTNENTRRSTGKTG